MTTKKEKQTLTITPIAEEDMKRLSPSNFLSTISLQFPNPLNTKESIVGTFQVADGFAIGTAVINGETREVVAHYPLVAIVKTSKVFKHKIQEHLGLEEDKDPSIYEILCSYAQFRILR